MILIAAIAAVGLVTLSNTVLPRDQNGDLLLTGEADVLLYDRSYYFYFNNWGGCAGVNCCNSSGGCASCCFDGPEDGCVYRTNHTVEVYKTDLQNWEYLGVALSVQSRHEGIEFRPHVIYNEKSKLFVMWYEDRWSTGHQRGYAIATSTTPEGSFTTVNNSVQMSTKDKIGDFDIFVDDDKIAYHVRTGFSIEKLNDDYTGVTGESYHFTTPKAAEGPVFFKNKNTYYILPGTSCCACIGGSSVFVFASHSPLGPYKFLGDIGSKQPFNKHSPHNFVTNAQASAVFEVVTSSGNESVWLGNQWVTSTLPGNPRNHDLLYFTKLPFLSNGSIAQLYWKNEETFNI